MDNEVGDSSISEIAALFPAERGDDRLEARADAAATGEVTSGMWRVTDRAAGRLLLQFASLALTSFSHSRRARDLSTAPRAPREEKVSPAACFSRQ